MASTRRILVTGATGKQGGAVINALIDSPASYPTEIIALTRNPTSPAAIELKSRHPSVKLLQGDLDDCPAIFESAGGKGTVWGVFSVQVPAFGKKKAGEDKEVRSGCALIDAAVENGVGHFVYASVGDGGVGSREQEPRVPHFESKWRIEEYLKTKAGGMTWTILQPVAFMENGQPGFVGKVFAAMWDGLGEKRLQVVATRDIGTFGAMSFRDVQTWKGRSIILVGDQLTRKEADEVYWREMGRAMPRTYGFVGSLVQWLIPEMGIMFRWFVEVGYRGSVKECQKYNPKMLDFETWLREESDHKTWRTETK